MVYLFLFYACLSNICFAFAIFFHTAFVYWLPQFTFCSTFHFGNTVIMANFATYIKIVAYHYANRK